VSILGDSKSFHARVLTPLAVVHLCGLFLDFFLFLFVAHVDSAAQIIVLIELFDLGCVFECNGPPRLDRLLQLLVKIDRLVFGSISAVSRIDGFKRHAIIIFHGENILLFGAGARQE